MNLEQARSSFINQWGDLANKWGISQSTARLYAYLLVQTTPRCTDTIMNDLSLSRDHVDASVRELIDWGIVYKSSRKSGSRKTYYTAESDMWLTLQRIMKERKRRELGPILKQIDTWQQLKDPEAPSSEVAAFKKTIAEIKEVGVATDQFLETASSTRRMMIYQWFHRLSGG